MKKKNDKIFALYIILTVYLVLKNIVLIPVSVVNYTYIFNPIIWIIIGIYCLIFFKRVYSRYRNKVDKIQITVIFLLVYVIIYFSLGLVLNYEKSPYSHNIINIIKNIWAFIIPFICMEYVRFSLVKNSSKKNYNYILLTAILILLEINFSELFASLSNIADTVEYISSVLLPLLAKSSVLTYLMIVGGLYPALIYQLFMQGIIIFLPVFPKLNWFMIGSIGCSLPVILFLAINNFIEKKNVKFSSLLKRNQSPIKNAPIYLVLIILILFFYGAFKYRPVAVMSNSMYPVFQRGDAVIIEAITDENISTIEIGTIIMYNLDGASVIHRVIQITEKSGRKLYKTKGDNNNTADTNLVEQSQIIGIEKFGIPKIGYPSVIIKSIFDKQVVGVET